MKKVKYLNRRGLSHADYVVALRGLQVMTQAWVAALSQAMVKTGKGYKKAPQGRTGRGTDRRADKLNGTTKFLRGVRVRGIVGGHVSTRPWIKRRAA